MTQSAFSTGRETVAGRVRARTAIAMAMALMLIAICSGSGVVVGQCSYSTQQIVAPACPFGNTPPLIGRGLNTHGHVVGDFADCEVSGVRHGFLWTPEDGLTVFEHPPGVAEAHHFDISDNGMIVGIHRFPSQGFRGFAYDPGTESYQYLAPLDEDAVAQTVSSANAINNAGIVAGSRIIGKPGQSPMPYNAVIWDTNTGEVIDLGVMDVGPNSAARTVNQLGEVGGWTGPTNTTGIGFFALNNGRIHLLDQDWNATISTVLAINDVSYAAGSVVLKGSSQSRAFIWNMKELTIVDPPRGFTETGTADLNNLGQLLARSAPGNVPTLWQNGMTFLLSDLVDNLSNLGTPQAINDAGQILVRIGNTRAGVLTPTNVPFTDLNYDCNVDVYDLLIMLDQWGPVDSAATGRDTGIPSADLNGDGVVNVLDLLILLEHWNP